MSKKLAVNSHIINGKVEDTPFVHPYEDHKDQAFSETSIKRFLSNFTTSKVSYSLITDDVNFKLFVFNIDGQEYNIYLDQFDSGGSRAEAKRKKISIPFSKGKTNPFMQIIHDCKPVLVINEYVFLEEKGGVIKPSNTQHIYAIVKPKEVYKSRGTKTGNNCSRWVKLETMLECYNKNIPMMNHVDNVYVIPPSKLENYFKTKIVDAEYDAMINYVYEEIKRNADLTKEQITNIFRTGLVKEQGMHCQFDGCKVCESDLLVASHIESKASIKKNDSIKTKEEKIKQMTDPNNGFMLCAVHDKLFDRKYITISDKGELIISPKIKGQLDEWNLSKYVGKVVIKHLKPETLKYLKIHQKQYLKKNKLTTL